MDYQNDYNELLNQMYGIYGFSDSEDELRAKVLVQRLESNLSREDIKRVQKLCKIAYGTGASDYKHTVSEFLNKTSLS